MGCYDDPGTSWAWGVNVVILKTYVSLGDGL